MRRRRATWLAAVASLLAMAVAGPARPQPAPGDRPSGAGAGAPVDVALVLALDASASLGGGAAAGLRAAHAEALRDPAVAAAIARGGLGAVSIAVLEWGSPGEIRLLVPWTRVDGPAAADALADRLMAAPPPAEAGATAVGAALAASLALLETAPPAGRRVVDLASDGFSNAGIAPAVPRARAQAAGVTVNALVLADRLPWLPDWYAGEIVTGPFAFVRTVDGARPIAYSLVAKLVLEIAAAEAAPESPP